MKILLIGFDGFLRLFVTVYCLFYHDYQVSNLASDLFCHISYLDRGNNLLNFFNIIIVEM